MFRRPIIPSKAGWAVLETHFISPTICRLFIVGRQAFLAERKVDSIITVPTSVGAAWIESDLASVLLSLSVEVSFSVSSVEGGSITCAVYGEGTCSLMEVLAFSAVVVKTHVAIHRGTGGVSKMLSPTAYVRACTSVTCF